MHFLSVRGQFVYLMCDFPLTVVGKNALGKLLKHHKMLLSYQDNVSNYKSFCLVYELSVLSSGLHKGCQFM